MTINTLNAYLKPAIDIILPIDQDLQMLADHLSLIPETLICKTAEFTKKRWPNLPMYLSSLPTAVTNRFPTKLQATVAEMKKQLFTPSNMKKISSVVTKVFNFLALRSQQVDRVKNIGAQSQQKNVEFNEKTPFQIALSATLLWALRVGTIWGTNAAFTWQVTLLPSYIPLIGRATTKMFSWTFTSCAVAASATWLYALIAHQKYPVELKSQ